MAQTHAQLQAIIALDQYLIDQFLQTIALQYRALALECRQAFARAGTIPAVMRTYDTGIVRINQAQDALIRSTLFIALAIANRAFARELWDVYPPHIFQKIDLTAGWTAAEEGEDIAEALFPFPEEMGDIRIRLGGGMSDEDVRAYMNARDEWGFTFSERIWKNDAYTRAELTKALEDHLRSGRAVLTDAETLRHFQVDDPTLPKYLQELQRKAQAALGGSLTARAEFDKALARVREEVEKMKSGPMGMRTATLRLLRGLEQAVKKGVATVADDAISLYIDRRAKYRAATLLRTEGVRASQFATWEKYKKQDFVLAIQWNLSLMHRQFDICDGKATADVGLGPGVYYKDYIPYPDHPRGICYLTSVLPKPEDLGDAIPWEPSDPERYREVVDMLREGDFVRTLNNLGARKDPPFDELHALIAELPKIPPKEK